jgi:hypothetical protein
MGFPKLRNPRQAEAIRRSLQTVVAASSERIISKRRSASEDQQGKIVKLIDKLYSLTELVPSRMNDQ